MSVPATEAVLHAPPPEPALEQLGVPRKAVVRTRPLVLVVDHDGGMRQLLRLSLSDQGFTTVTENGADAIQAAADWRPDLLLLEPHLPGINGYEIMRKIQQQHHLPTIIISARVADHDKILGLNMGADDYITKPVNPDEVAARIHAVLRRYHPEADPRQRSTAGDILVDLDKRLVTRGGRVLDLTRTEWLLLQELAAHPGRVLSNTELLLRVWGPEYTDESQYLRVWVSRLRSKLGRHGGHRLIKTMNGMGYMFNWQPDARPRTDSQS
jgi:two-component system, OmpR family, KDP operon response regulator KdpE